jgi:carbamoyltransferase
MDILGIHCNTKREDEEQTGYAFHDGAAVLLRNGAIVAAIEEERLNRLKHSNTFPAHAIHMCLKRGGITLDQVDHIALNSGEQCFNDIAQDEWQANNGMDACNGRTLLADCFKRVFGIDVSEKLFFSPHHIAHAWSACAASGFDKSLVFVADGDGDNLSGMVLLADGANLETLRVFSVAQSLGHLYSNMIRIIGYNRFDEYKAMGLAPYGDPTVFEGAFSTCYRLLPDGDYEIAPLTKWVGKLQHLGLIERARRKHQPFSQEHKDIAAALQTMLERIVLHVLSFFRHHTGCANLCAAGGVFHNCSLNGAVLYSKLFDRVFVQPAAHDAGGAYGAAIHAANHYREPIGPSVWKHVYFGSDLGEDGQLLSTLKRWCDFVEIEPMGHSLERPARLLADGAVIGWVHGRSEFGPRALGNRSILADPRPAENKDRINALVKKREAFRPFAPAVLIERLHDYFEVPDNDVEFPFMVFVLKVRPEHQSLLGAVTHVDGTARVQTVSPNINQRFWNLIHTFEGQTGVPVLLNTSFNNNAEPIVNSPDDAIGCYLTTGLDALVIGDYLLWKKSADISGEWLEHLVPQLPGFRRLVKRGTLNPDTRRFENIQSVQTTRARLFGPPERQITESVYQVLQLVDGRRTLGELIRKTNIGSCGIGEVYAEVRQLWGERVLALSPPL